jgi:hypothetical protein
VKLLLFVAMLLCLIVALVAFSGGFFRGGFVEVCELPFADPVPPCPFSLWLTSRPGALAGNMSIGLIALIGALLSTVMLLFVFIRGSFHTEEERYLVSPAGEKKGASN